MDTRLLAIIQIDRQLKSWQTANQKYSRPRDGWIKTLRTALGMTATQLAERLGLSQSRISQLEEAEKRDAVTLRSLREAANAMGCELVYAIVPKNNATLASIIKDKAEQVALERVSRVAHSMALEDQSVDPAILKRQQQELAKKLIEDLSKEIWIVPKNKRKKKNMK